MLDSASNPPKIYVMHLIKADFQASSGLWQTNVRSGCQASWGAETFLSS